MKKKISVYQNYADILVKVSKLLESGQSVTLIPNETGVDIFHAYTNQLVLFAPETQNLQGCKQQVFQTGDRVASTSQVKDLWMQLCIKRVESKDRIIASPIDICGKVDWTTELLFTPQQLVIVQAFQDYLLNGLDISTISEEWAAIESAKNLRKELEAKLKEVKKLEEGLQRPGACT
ncbi:MAG: hypothetical protein PUP92_34400 [Rhizonema sp. PD38]|nr:hypothetical protein [Rhizonema sp. PD38]